MAWKPDYVTPSELKSYLRIDADDDADDAFIALWVTTASRNVDGFCHRQFGKVDAAEVRTYEGVYDRHLGTYVYRIDDLSSASGMTVSVADGGAEVTAYTLLPRNAAADGEPFTELRCTSCGPLDIEAPGWGWSAVPSPVKVGLLLQSARLAARRDSPFGVAGSPSEGSEVRLFAQLDADFKTSLRASGLVRERWAA